MLTQKSRVSLSRWDAAEVRGWTDTSWLCLQSWQRERTPRLEFFCSCTLITFALESLGM